MCVWTELSSFWYISYVPRLLLWHYEASELRGGGAGAGAQLTSAVASSFADVLCELVSGLFFFFFFRFATSSAAALLLRFTSCEVGDASSTAGWNVYHITYRHILVEKVKVQH